LSDRPNVLLIFADQLRHQALACNGDPNAVTPNIDRLAAEGVACDMAVSHYPVCMPFRAGLVTGQYANVHGLRVHGDMLRPDRRTVAHAFADAGYRTSYVGKFHMASTASNQFSGEEFWIHPEMRAGFEDFFGFDIANHYYNTHYCTGEIARGIAIEGHQTDGLTDATLDYLAGTAMPSGAPWFHVIAYEAPHPGGGSESNRFMPFPAPPEFEAMFDPEGLELRPNVAEGDAAKVRPKAAGYYAMLAHLDHNVGRILALLEERGELDRTLVAVFSDHGEMLGSHGRFHKEVPYDEAERIPLIMRLPGTLARGERYGGVASGIDIFPTCAALCGVEYGGEVQGLDLSHAFRGDDGPTRDAALIQWLGRTRFGWGDYPYRAIRTEKHTYSVCDPEVNARNGGHFRLLFDNENDPYQLDNLFGAKAARGLQRELHAELERAVRDSGEPLPDFVAAEGADLRT
jgi:arylsulfatase A-like enzyme